ncbi:TSC22 domain family protein 2 [Kryptolebias marmoratus]|uniref:TSC22 domain family protein 2 n=1 Tax=Kryptolebias marmoratus TaxID=37003 RepID=UPI0007F91C96|nr:TSC22 domain family protein 2 [Kryptolebias marmoratus]
MSKIAGKKRSCFEITSVTPAQVAASCIPDDTESLDDLDESRAEDVSSEMPDVSRVEQGVCGRSSPEEALNNGGDHQEGQLPNTGPVNGGLCYKSAPTGRVTPHSVGGNVPASATAQPFVPSSNTVPAASTSVAPSSSCSSRFRVIKLDHGTGEPFRRGRWTCTEFYEKDSDSSGNRTVDSIKPTVTLDQSIDRDSGLGATITSIVSNSAFAAQAFENSTDSGYSVSAGHPTHSHTSDPPQQGYVSSPQVGNGASAFQPPGFTATAPQQTKQAQVNMQPVNPQTFLSNSLNGVHQGVNIPPASQSQQFAYSNHPTGFSTAHPDYHQQHFGLNITSSPGGSSASQVSSPSFTPTGPGTQGLLGEAVSAQGIGQQQMSLSSILPGNTQQQPVNQTQPLGGLGIAPAPSATTTSSHISGQNVPAAVPSTTNIPLGVLRQVPSTGGHVQLQGAHGGTTTGLHSGFSNQAEDSRQNSDVLPHQSAGAVPGIDGVKSPVSEGLNLPTPTVNSLFNIHIPLDEDEDSASGASVVAIDNKIEQAMDLVKSHLMYAVREEVEVLKEQIKELYERNSALERENAVLKSLANSEQLSQLSSQLSSLSAPLQLHQYSLVKSAAPSLVHHDGSQSVPYQPNITSA